MPTLVVIRGNSGSGKTTVAREVRRRFGRGCALVEQDYLRRVVLREHDNTEMGPRAPEFIAGVVESALALGYHVVLEGILHRVRNGAALGRLIDGHRGPSFVFYLDVSLPETLRRHEERAASVGFTADDMRAWYEPGDLLGRPGEQIIPESSTLDETVSTILHASGLASAAALTPCPRRCPRCKAKA
jgi:predicted kinase